MQIIGEWIMRLLFWNDCRLITLRNLKPEKVVSDGHGHHCSWHEHQCMGRTYVQYIFVSMWRLDGRMRCGCHYLPVTDCYADYSRFFFPFVSDSWDFPDPSYFIFNL